MPGAQSTGTLDPCARLTDTRIATVAYPHTQKTAMTITSDQRRILRDIDATTSITESETDWAVNAGYAVLAEDGDIDLTNEGRALLDAS